MDTLSSKREEQLAALLNELADRATPEAIMRCMEAIGVEGTSDADLARVDAAVAGSWAFDRMLTYLVRLRSLNEERMELGIEIGRLKRHPYPKSEDEIQEAANAAVMAPFLAGKQEVVFNFWTICVQHIRSLLLVVAESVGYAIPQDDLDFLDKFRFLRNHYEHWYSRLPGKSGEIGLFTKRMANGEYRLVGGLETDEQDRIIVVEPKKAVPVAHIVDLTNAGLERIERIVRETAENAKAKALQNVRDHYVANPDKAIPSPKCVDDGFLLNVGGGGHEKPRL